MCYTNMGICQSQRHTQKLNLANSEKKELALLRMSILLVDKTQVIYGMSCLIMFIEVRNLKTYLFILENY